MEVFRVMTHGSPCFGVFSRSSLMKKGANFWDLCGGAAACRSMMLVLATYGGSKSATGEIRLVYQLPIRVSLRSSYQHMSATSKYATNSYGQSVKRAFSFRNCRIQKLLFQRQYSVHKTVIVTLVFKIIMVYIPLYTCRSLPSRWLQLNRRYHRFMVGTDGLQVRKVSVGVVGAVRFSVCPKWHWPSFETCT